MNVHVVIRYVDYARGVTEIDSVWRHLEHAETRAKEIENIFDEIQTHIINDVM